MDLNTKFKRSAICGGVSVVQSARLGSFSSFSSVACIVASIGTLVNSDSTSKILWSCCLGSSHCWRWIRNGLNWSPCALNFLLTGKTKHSWLFVCIRFPGVTSDCSMIKWLRDQCSDSRLRVVSLIIYFKTPDVTFLVFWLVHSTPVISSNAKSPICKLIHTDVSKFFN